MRKMTWLAVLCGVLCFIGSFAGAENRAPDLEQRQNEFFWDFGRVKAGKIIKHDFLVKNYGPGMMKITNIQPSCGCLSVKIKDRVLKPGASTVLKLSFDTSGELGQLQQFVYVQTDSIDNPVFRYIIEVQVEK